MNSVTVSMFRSNLLSLRTATVSAAFFLLTAFWSPLIAQDIDRALELYNNGEYEQAITELSTLRSPQAKLFTGKSYYGLGNYLKAKYYLDGLPENAPVDIRQEARYTSALADFHLKQFGSALNTLHGLNSAGSQHSVATEARSLYTGILNYLTLAQRRIAYQAANSPELKIDLVRSAFGKVDYETATLLFHELQNTLPSADSSRYSDLRETLTDTLGYNYRRSATNRYFAPRGTVYNIGATLPKFDPGTPQMGVSQGLFQGYLLAAEEFNQRNPDRKAFIRYRNTGADMDSAGHAMNYLAWSQNVDVVLGPLFSEPAMSIARLAEQYQIPMIAPLANSDSLNIDNPYVYQANPTFESHGRQMARFAVGELQMDTLAVLAEKNSLGETSAYAFREEAERMGAHIEHFFVEELADKGYEIITYTEQFAKDTVITYEKNLSGNVIDSTRADTTLRNSLDGIYAPFTGQAAPTLIDLLMIDLQVMQSDLTVLGSQEWGATEIPEERLRGRSVFFTESYFLNTKSPRVEQFRKKFQQRFGREADRYAMIGYDSADYILKILEEVENPALLKDVIKGYPLYEGLIGNIRFDGTHVNQEVKIFEFTPMGIQPALY